MRWTSPPDGDRAASPVIGVILMVAITVVLAAVIGTFVLDWGRHVRTNPQASVTFSETGNDVTVRVQSIQRADSIDVTGDCGDESISVEAGATGTVTCSNPGDKVVVTASYDGHDVVLQEYEFEG